MMRQGIFVFAVAAMATGAAAQTAARDPMQMDVAGIRLGMNLAQAEAALSRTYRCERQRGALTFEQLVSDEVQKRKTGSSGRWGGGLGTSFLKCAGPGGEELTIYAAETASGPLVHEFRLNFPKSKFEAAAVFAQVRARYGKPTRAVGQDFASWCNPGYDCWMLMGPEKGPIVQLDNGTFGVTLSGERGEAATIAEAAAVQTAADRLAPKKSKAAF